MREWNGRKQISISIFFHGSLRVSFKRHREYTQSSHFVVSSIDFKAPLVIHNKWGIWCVCRSASNECRNIYLKLTKARDNKREALKTSRGITERKWKLFGLFVLLETSRVLIANLLSLLLAIQFRWMSKIAWEKIGKRSWDAVVRIPWKCRKIPICPIFNRWNVTRSTTSLNDGD